MELCLATRNKGKVRELTDLLAGQPFRLRLITEFTDLEPAENGGTYSANATIKAKAAAAISGLPCLADDAGFTIDAMPGRFGVETAPDAEAMGGWPPAMTVISDLIGKGAPATARHHVTFVYATPAGQMIEASAALPGKVVYPGRGNAWAFNPYFLPDGSDLTYGELIERDGSIVKSKICPRTMAMEQLLAKLQLAPKTS